MSVDPVFRNVAGNMTGFHVWRIENMQVVPIPSEAWGKFFTGDAYIVLSSAPHGSRYHDYKIDFSRQCNLIYTYNWQWWCVCQVISSQWKSWATYPLLVGRRGINRWGDEDISRFIHIHVGLMCQAAIAAYKSVELDEHLGGSPIQHREVQGQESARFQAYFKKGVRYLSGGAKVN